MTTFLDRLFGTFLGIEFKEDSLTVTYLKNSLSGISLLSSSTFPLRDDESAVSEIREYISQRNLSVNKVFVSIPDKWAITKFIGVPSTRGKNALSQLMRFEIERHIPFQIEDVLYDFQVVYEKDTAYTVVFVAVQKEKVDYIREFLEKLSLKPHGVTSASFAILNTIELSGASTGGWQEVAGFARKSRVLGQKGEVNISLYIDRINASLAIIRNGSCTHLRSFIFDMAKPLEIFLDDIAIYLTDVASELYIESFNKLILSGNVSSMPGLTDALKEKLGINVVTINLLESLKGSEIHGLASSVGACFAGLGIGRFRINILPHKVDHEIKKAASLTTKIFISLILFLTIGIFTTEGIKQKKFLVKVEEELRNNEPAVIALEKISSELKSFKKQRDFLHGVKESEITLEVLAELTNILPQDTWITNLEYKGFNFKDEKKSDRELIISGYADSSSRLIPLLEDSLFFEKVEFVGSIKKTRGKEGFKLRAYIVKPVKGIEETMIISRKDAKNAKGIVNL